jgi:aryl-alcohol dehydrogenase-like predicted oxidoreductase
MQKELASETGKAKLEKVKELVKVAEELDAPVAALSIAWLLKNSRVSSVITGASKPEQVALNVKVQRGFKEV